MGDRTWIRYRNVYLSILINNSMKKIRLTWRANSEEQVENQSMMWRLWLVFFIAMFSLFAVKAIFDLLFGKDPTLTSDRFVIYFPIILISFAPRVMKRS